MHHLLITLVGIALAVATTVAAVPYLGKHFTDARGEAIAAQVVSQMRGLSEALDLFYEVNGRMPEGPSGPGAHSLGELGLSTDYLRSIPSIGDQPWTYTPEDTTFANGGPSFSVAVTSRKACEILNAGASPIRTSGANIQSVLSAPVQTRSYCYDVTLPPIIKEGEPYWDVCASWDQALADSNGYTTTEEYWVDGYWETQRWIAEGWVTEEYWVDGYWQSHELVTYDPPKEVEHTITSTREIGPMESLQEVYVEDPSHEWGGYWAIDYAPYGYVSVGGDGRGNWYLISMPDGIPLGVPLASAEYRMEHDDASGSLSYFIDFEPYIETPLPEEEWYTEIEYVTEEWIELPEPVWVEGYMDTYEWYNSVGYWRYLDPAEWVEGYYDTWEMFVPGDGCVGDWVTPTYQEKQPPAFRFVTQ
jgi:hypothetical protein